jgi:hypothetical protein
MFCRQERLTQSLLRPTFWEKSRPCSARWPAAAFAGCPVEHFAAAPTVPDSVIGNTTDSDSVILGSSPSRAAPSQLATPCSTYAFQVVPALFQMEAGGSYQVPARSPSGLWSVVQEDLWRDALLRHRTGRPRLRIGSANKPASWRAQCRRGIKSSGGFRNWLYQRQRRKADWRRRCVK